MTAPLAAYHMLMLRDVQSFSSHIRQRKPHGAPSASLSGPRAPPPANQNPPPLRSTTQSKQCSIMCGIAGVIDFHGRPIDQETLGRLCAALDHRGPDDSGIWVHESEGFSAGLAHTRLAVIDPSPSAHQPMTDPQGRWAIAYNGELYNYPRLREQLPGPFRTSCDTEVALNACIAWGPAAVERFDAMWAMAVVDTQERTGHLSRDPFGIKPLYYAYHDGRLLFASELRAMRSSLHLPTTIDPNALACYLNTGYIPHPYTIYEGVHKLPPGHRLRFDGSGPTEPERFFHLRPPAAPPPTYTYACSELRQRIQTAVTSQRISDVPLGAFLSGGLDSSVVVACLAQAARANGPAHRVKTFSIGYRDHAAYDETRYAEQVARHFNTEHHTFHLTFDDILATLEPMLNHLSEPFADSSLLPTSLVSQHTRQHVTVALSGDGGDELFGGYWRYLGHHYLQQYHRWPACIRKGLIEPLLRRMPSAKSTRWLNRVRQAHKLLRGDLSDPLDRHLAWARHMDDRLAAELLGPHQARKTADNLKHMYKRAPGSWYDTYQPSNGLQRILLADLAIGLPGDMLHKVDTASMCHSLEVRVPLLTADVVHFVAGLPIDYKITGTTGKRILRDAFADVIPENILNRSKMGFEVPMGEFLRHELRDMFNDVVTTQTLRELGLNPKPVARWYDQHTRRQHDHADLLWALLVLCQWHHNHKQIL